MLEDPIYESVLDVRWRLLEKVGDCINPITLAGRLRIVYSRAVLDLVSHETNEHNRIIVQRNLTRSRNTRDVDISLFA